MSLLKIFSALFAAGLFGVKSYSLCPVWSGTHSLAIVASCESV
jgi:hypothetical protein